MQCFYIVWNTWMNMQEKGLKGVQVHMYMVRNLITEELNH